MDDVQLVSAVGMDYRGLCDLLAAGNWKEADQETERLMLKVAGRNVDSFLNISSIDNFPFEDLRTIDQLWVKYSNGRFGFSVQKGIYQSLGGTREYEKIIWNKFGDRVGWRVNSKWIWLSPGTRARLYFKDEMLAQGHLPWYVFTQDIEGGSFLWVWGSLLSRREL